MSLHTALNDMHHLTRERDVYREFYEAKEAYELSLDPGSENLKYLDAAERFSKAKEAVTRLREGGSQ